MYSAFQFKRHDISSSALLCEILELEEWNIQPNYCSGGRGMVDSAGKKRRGAAFGALRFTKVTKLESIFRAGICTQTLTDQGLVGLGIVVAS
jgi:hypothetical protein